MSAQRVGGKQWPGAEAGCGRCRRRVQGWAGPARLAEARVEPGGERGPKDNEESEVDFSASWPGGWPVWQPRWGRGRRAGGPHNRGRLRVHTSEVRPPPSFKRRPAVSATFASQEKTQYICPFVNKLAFTVCTTAQSRSLPSTECFSNYPSSTKSSSNCGLGLLDSMQRAVSKCPCREGPNQ